MRAASSAAAVLGGSTVCATCEDHPPTPYWMLAAKLMTLTKTLPTPLQTILDAELYKAVVLLNGSNAEQVLNGWTLAVMKHLVASSRV